MGDSAAPRGGRPGRRRALSEVQGEEELHGDPDERRKRYWGLRPRRSIRRWSLVVIAAALAAVLAHEAIWLVSHRP